MDKKWIICIIFIIAIIGIAAFYFSSLNKDYSIENATIDIDVSEYGSIYVHEDYDYKFKGEFNGIYRDIPLKKNEEFSFFRVNVDGAYYNVEESDDGNGKHLKIYLYSDSARTQKIKDANVHVSYRYGLKDVILLYDDVGVLQFKLWDKYWDKGVNGLTAKVHFPGEKNNTYFINPKKYTKSSNLNGDNLTITANSIPKGEIYELLALIDHDDFYKNPISAKIMHGNGRDIVLHNLNDSLDEINFADFVLNIYRVLAILAPVGLIITYLRYGREPKVDYDGVYERELPSDDSPEFVSSMFGRYSFIGKPTRDGFKASILNIINKKVIDIDTQESDEIDSRDLLLTFNHDRKEDLTQSESIIFNTLSEFAKDNVLNLSTLKGKLKNTSKAKWFMGKYDAWTEQVKEENKSKFDKYFNRRGLRISRYIATISFFSGIVLFFAAMLLPTPDTRIEAAKMAAVIWITGIVAYLLPDDYFGSWTKEGRLVHLKWKNFKKFLEDNSLIKEHPPESIIIWKNYLIYGAALGITSKVYEAMKINVSDVSEYDNDGIFLYHSSGGFSTMDSAIETGYVTANPSSSGGGGSDGGGSFGGGSGGGGGGAF